MNKFHYFFTFMFVALVSQNLGAMDVPSRKKELTKKLGQLELKRLDPRSQSNDEIPDDLPIIKAPNIVERRPSIDVEPEDTILQPELSKVKKIWKKLTLKKNKSNKKRNISDNLMSFERRKELYLLQFFRLNEKDNNCKLNKDCGIKQFNKLKTFDSRSKIYGRVRESKKFLEDYKALRKVAKAHLLESLNVVIDHHLNFLVEHSTWYSLYLATEDAKKNELNKKELDFNDIENINFELSSGENSVLRQNEYLEFLEHYILPLAKECPMEVRSFFHKMACSMREALDKIISEPGEKAGISPEDLAVNNFMLYIVNKLLSEQKEYPFLFCDEDLRAMENDELGKTLELQQFPEPASEIEIKLIDGVVERMGRFKNGFMWELNHKDPLRARKLALNKLMQKTFMEEVEFQPSDYGSFVGQFYLMIGRRDSELNMRLNKFKEDVKTALFAGFDS